MKTELYSISKIFSERLLRIPDYQRGYAWQDRHLKDYWNDLIQLEQGKNHYVGVLTLETVKDETYSGWKDDLWIISSKNYEPYFIVDGQQRLTTSIILIQSILEVIGDDVLNFTSSDDIRKKFIYETKPDGISGSYLFGYDADNPSYEFLKRKIFNDKSVYQNVVQETIYTNNLTNAKNFFIDKLKLLSHNDLEAVYKKVTQHFLFNIYSMSDDIDVHVSFETMNNRGKPLSHLELLKNRLIYLSTKMSDESYEVDKLRLSINECWKTIYHQLGRNKEKQLSDDSFLLNHFILYYGDKFLEEFDDINHYFYFKRTYRDKYQSYLLDDKFTTKSLQLECTCEEKNNTKCKCPTALTVQDIYDYVSSLKTSVEIWYQICNPSDSGLSKNIVTCLERFDRLNIAPDEVRPLLMIALQKLNEDDCLRFFNELEIFLFNLSFLCLGCSTVTFTPKDLIDWASKLSNGQVSVESLIHKMKDIRTELANNDQVFKLISKFFKERGYYKWRNIRYFLYEYEVYLQNTTKTHRQKIDPSFFFDDIRDHSTIEHIYPQRATNEYWKNLYKDYTAKERSFLRHSLGNLVPLSRPKNSSFQNKPFPEKVSNSKNKVGFKYGSYSEIELTDNEHWSPIEIMNRGVTLIDFLHKRWKINVGNREDIIDFLNYRFVLDKEKKRKEKTNNKFKSRL
ncbi:DUF262 domain-containing protein [Photobacterium sp. GB-3]|uniref:DUF262 domain-containing protein n=1 Tax=Photobacterium sp. GB-3 TaxID=2022110 RepID=UPI000D15CFCF|nr:DUF262 domain-containing protein [Photobacterium sp. GB-3]PSV56680.1 hypothetical protein C9J43_10550 [Photobacterium sp. GB-3]